MSQIIYPITHLPPVIDIGKQTEKGVTRIGFDVHEWLDNWPGMKFSVQPVRPGEKESYLAATDMVGSVIFWLVGAMDTERAGSGTVEVLGVTEDERKLSAICRTAINETTTTTTAEIPEPGRPWVDQVILAGESAKAGAKAAEESAQEASQAATAAGQYSANADAQAEAAAKSAASAEQSAVSADQDAQSALDSANAASKSANDADIAKKDADTYAGQSKVHADNALTYSNVAMEHKNSTEQLAASALNNANDAKSYKESAANSASNAYSSYTGAVNAANTASQKATAAATSEKNASAAASGAAASEAKAQSYAASAAADAATSAVKADSAAESAAAAAKSAEQADRNPADVYIVKKVTEDGTFYADKTPDEIKTAALNGKACILVRDNVPYKYIGLMTNQADVNEGECPTFSFLHEENNVIRQSYQYVCSDRRLQGVTYDAKAKNPEPLKLTGAVGVEYDGSTPAEVEVPDVFIVRKTTSGLSHTASEVAKAVVTEKRVGLLINETGSMVYCYTGTEYDAAKKATAMVFTAPGYYLGDTGMEGIKINRVMLYMDGTFIQGISLPAKTPNPFKVKFAGAVEAEYDGSSEVKVEIPSGGAGLPETADPLKQLVTDQDGKVTWEDRLAYETEREVVNLEATELTYDAEEEMHCLLTPWEADIVADGVYTVNYNGANYECMAIDYASLVPEVSGGAFLLGNMALIGGEGIEGANPDAPFLLMASTNALGATSGNIYAMFLAADGATSVTISVRGVEHAIKTIDPKYLPDTDGGVVTAHATITDLAVDRIALEGCDMSLADLNAAYISGKTVQIMCSNETRVLRGLVNASATANGSTVLQMDVPRDVLVGGFFIVGIMEADGVVTFEQIGKVVAGE